MKNSIWILLYLLILLLIVFFEYNKSNNKIQNTSVYEYKIEENKALKILFLEYMKESNISFDIDSQWGIVKKKTEEKNSTKELNVTKEVSVTLKENTLCIEKNCFKLLGIFTEDNKEMASFYAKESKEKVQQFLVGEIMSVTIKIKSIMKKNVIFKDINSTREWQMKLFDVNSSKYKPKDFE